MKLRRSGFTLMEILLVSALIATISIAIFAALNNGIKLWGRGIAVDKKGDVFIGLEKISQDIRGVIPYSLINFQGSEEKISFATIVFTPADANSSRAEEGLVDSIGAVEYRYEPADGKIFRRQADYGQALKKQWGKEQEIASGISDVHFDYFVDGERRTEGRAHVDSQIPTGVLLTLRLGPQGQQTMQRYFEIPVGGR